MEFNNDIEDLINGLYYPSLFYIPKLIAKDFSETAKQELHDFGLFEDVGILKTDGTVESVKWTCNKKSDIFSKTYATFLN